MATLPAADIRKIVVACDAGMGSSVMLAGQIRKKLKKFPVTVEHSPVTEIPTDADLVICHAGLADRARTVAAGIPVVAFQVFIGDPAVEKILTAIRDHGALDV